MSRDVWIYAVRGERHALVRGPVGSWLREQRIPAMRVAMHGGYFLRSERVSDVVALMEFAGLRVNLRRHPAPPYVPPTALADDLAS